MFTVKQSILRIFFVLEILVFICVYLLGAHGVQLMLQLKRENDALVQEIQHLSITVNDLEYEIHVWNTTTFYKEKFAREQLQMAKEDETIFYLTPPAKKPATISKKERTYGIQTAPFTLFI